MFVDSDNEMTASAILVTARLGGLRLSCSRCWQVFMLARSQLATFAYIETLLAEPPDRRSCWQLAEAAGHRSPRQMQALLAKHL